MPVSTTLKRMVQYRSTSSLTRQQTWRLTNWAIGLLKIRRQKSRKRPKAKRLRKSKISKKRLNQSTCLSENSISQINLTLKVLSRRSMSILSKQLRFSKELLSAKTWNEGWNVWKPNKRKLKSISKRGKRKNLRKSIGQESSVQRSALVPTSNCRMCLPRMKVSCQSSTKLGSLCRLKWAIWSLTKLANVPSWPLCIPWCWSLNEWSLLAIHTNCQPRSWVKTGSKRGLSEVCSNDLKTEGILSNFLKFSTECIHTYGSSHQISSIMADFVMHRSFKSVRNTHPSTISVH